MNKRFLIVLIIYLFAACDSVEEVQSIEEFDVPFESNVVEGVYTYVRQPGGDTIVHKYVYADFVRNRYWQIIKVNSETTTQRIYELKSNTKKLIAEYQHQSTDNLLEGKEKIKGDILQYEQFDVGHRFKGLKTKITFTNSDGFITTHFEKDSAIKDITLFWEGNEVKALQIDYENTVTERIRYFPFVQHTYEYTGSSFYVEGIGLYKWFFKSGDDEYETKLISIKKVER